MTVERTRWYPAEPAEVWEAVVDPDRLAAWFDGRAGVIEEMVPAERLAFTWEGDGDAPCSEVVITLTPDEGGTRVHVVEQAMVPAPTVPIGFQARALSRA